MSKEKEFNSKKFAVILIILLIIIVFAIYFFMIQNFKVENQNQEQFLGDTKSQSIQSNEKNFSLKNEYALTDNNFSKFDLSFLKFENEKENKIYSPLSIKYAFNRCRFIFPAHSQYTHAERAARTCRRLHN